MHPRLRFLPLLALAGLSVGIASAAPSSRTPAKKKASKARGGRVCTATAPPNKAKCLSKGYLDSPCGRKFKDTCAPIVKGELGALYKKSRAPEVKMLRPGKTQMPGQLRKGKVWEYAGPKSKKKLLGNYAKTKLLKGSHAAKGLKTTIKPVPRKAKGAPLKNTAAAKLASARKKHDLAKTTNIHEIKVMTSDNIFSRTGLTRPPGAAVKGLPINAHRNPAWDSNGQKITSCEEYGYERVYDWARYTDAVAACGSDVYCKLDVAFLPATPGIASRKLKRKDGKPLDTQISGGGSGARPKNVLFELGSRFAFSGPGGGAPNLAEAKALAAVLDSGKKHYRLGCKSGCGKTGFKDTWDFHRKMYNRNRAVSMAEFEEYERRKAKFNGLMAQWIVAVGSEYDRLKVDVVEMNQWLTPLDIYSSDPWERMIDVQKFDRRRIKKVKTLRKKGLIKGYSPFGVKPRATKKRTVGLLEAPSSMPVGVLAAPRSVPKSKKATKGMKGPKGKKLQEDCSKGSFKGILELAGRGPISCQIGRFLRQEWRRKKAGHRSCLDLDNDDCDWSPMMFEAAFTKGVPYIQEQNKHEALCVDYIGNGLDTPMPNITATQTHIKGVRELAEKAMEYLKPYAQGTTQHGNKYGKGWSDSDQFGDKDWFAAGYDYDVGFDVAPVKSKNKRVCQLGGGARGGFGVDGWFIKKKFEVVDGLASADFNRNADKKGNVHAHVRVFGKNVFKPVNQPFQGAWAEPVASGSVQIPSNPKPSFTFMAGFVPITGAAWGEFEYGARFKASVVSETNASCNLNDVKLGAKAGFTPNLALNAKAQVGVGISGLLSAGVRGMVNLVTVGVPVDVGLNTKMKKMKSGKSEMTLGFDMDIKLALSTLSGWLALYVEALFYEEEFVLFRWNGVGPKTISLLGEPLKVDLPVTVMK